MENAYLKLKNNSRKWELVRSDNNLGYGGGIIFASQYVKKEYIAWMPGNMKIDPINGFNFVDKINLDNKLTYIKAKRINRPLIDNMKTKLFGIFASLYFGLYIYDAGGTPNMVHKSFFTLSKYMPVDFSFDVFVYFYFKFNKLNIIRPEIEYKTRLFGSSHWQNGLISELKLLFKILKYKKQWKKFSVNKYY